MHIALLAPFGLQPKGTTSARMMPLAHALARRGHMVRVVIPPWDDPSVPRGGRLKTSIASLVEGEDGRLSGVQVVLLPMRKWVPDSLGLTYGLVKSALWPATRANTPFERPEYGDTAHTLTTFRAEVVHVFKPVGYSGVAGLAMQALGVPWVLDMDDWEGPGGWADINPYSSAQKASIAAMEAVLPRIAGAVTAASRTLQARAWDFGLPRRRVFYMPNGVSRERYGAWMEPPDEAVIASLREQYRLWAGPVVVLYTRFAEFPFWWPLDIMKYALEDHPTAKLLVVGGGFFGEEEKLLSEAARLGIRERVALTGRVAEADLPAHLALGDVAIYPMSDNLINRAKSPVKVLEPMLMGIPMVAHRVGQVAEFIGDAGVLVEPGDLRGMGLSVSALLASPEKRGRLGEMAKGRVWAQFNWDRLGEAALLAYGVAMTRKRQAG